VVERPIDHLDESGWQVRTDVAKAPTLTLAVGGGELQNAGGGNREFAGHEIEQEHAHAVEIRLDRRGLAFENLGREIQRRAHEPRGAAAAAQLLAGAEVHDDDASALFAHDVLGFDVAMEQAHRVDRRQRRTDVLPDP
jgi:hypothetical protein